MMKFKNKTTEQIVEYALKAVPDYLAGIRSTGNFDVERCLRAEQNALIKLFNTSNGRSPYRGLSRDEVKEFDAAVAPYLPELRSRTQALKEKYLKGRKVSAINFATAEALIQDAFARRGLTADVNGQRYRARVLAKLPDGNMVRFYVKYRDLAKEKLMDGILDAVEDLSDAMARLGYGAAVRKA